MDQMEHDVQRIAKQGRWSAADGQRMVDAWHQSGESRTAFARRYGFAVHRLAYQISMIADAPRTTTTRGPLAFHPVHVVPERVDAGNATPIEIRVIRVPRGVPPEELRAVLAALDSHD